MRRLAPAIPICALASFMTVAVPACARAQSLDSPKVQELYAAAKKDGQVIVWGTQRREVEWIPAA